MLHIMLNLKVKKKLCQKLRRKMKDADETNSMKIGWSNAYKHRLKLRRAIGEHLVNEFNRQQEAKQRRLQQQWLDDYYEDIEFEKYFKFANSVVEKKLKEELKLELPLFFFRDLD